MTKTTWQKTPQGDVQLTAARVNRTKFLFAGLLILGAVVYLIISGTLSGQRYFITIDELLTEPEYAGKTVRVTGAVIGESIVYDSENLVLDFTVAAIPSETDNLARDLHLAVNDPDAARLQVHVENEVMPDLLQHEAQAILTGHLQEDGVFYTTELLLKCPSRFEESVPEQLAAVDEGA